MKAYSDETKILAIKKWLGSGSINIFGLPFSGKDTHGRELAKTLDAPLIGGGEIIRSDIAPKHMKDIIAQGLLAPTKDYLDLMLPYFAQDRFINKPVILNSVGRWYGEQTHVIKSAKMANHDIKAVIYLNINKQEVHKRWEKSLELKDRGKRHDDAEHKLETRISEFEIKTLPVIQFYRKKLPLIEVDGVPDRDKVSETIINDLYALSQK